jgi:site-specific DNA recombinase
LQQEFNSLVAQREAAEAYIRSQRAQGWSALAERYDDGGFSGGHMDRPALTRLLAQVQAGRIDCVVVYKVDRLSRSLFDFARIIGQFEQSGVSFVSVTQQFNTNTPLGRLTLHILLSFAQFEREMISERTRDKMTAARRKGRWTGGRPVLGYDIDPHGGRLLVNPAEAQQVRAIFELFEEKRTLAATARELNARGWTTKSWSTRAGAPHGGKPFSPHALRRLLRNPAYVGLILIQGELYPAQHPALVDRTNWERVGARLDAAEASCRPHRPPWDALLRGLLFCAACRSPMMPAYGGGRQRRRRPQYYVCASGQCGGSGTCPSGALDATLLEQMVLERISGLLSVEGAARPDNDQNSRLRAVIDRISYDGQTRRVSIALCGSK